MPEEKPIVEMDLQEVVHEVGHAERVGLTAHLTDTYVATEISKFDQAEIPYPPTTKRRSMYGTSNHARLARWLAAVALVVALVSFISGGRASGDPIDDKRAEAKALQDQIDANGIKIDALSEQYNGAQYRLEQAQAAIADAQQKLDATQAEVERLQALINERGAALYRSVGEGVPVGDVSNGNNVIKQSKYASLASERDNHLVKELHRAEIALRAEQANAEQAQADAQDEENRIKKAADAVEAANARQEELLAQVNGEIAELVAQEQARKEAEALAAAQARFAAAAAANTDKADNPPNAPPSSASGGGPTPGPSAQPKPKPSPSASPSPSAKPSPSASPPSANVPASGGADAAIAY